MNYLVHLFLAGPDPLERLGQLAGDFVKGPLTGRYPSAFERGLRLHRRLDAFAGEHPACRKSRARLDPALRLWRGVLVDVYYDHFLARDWEKYADLPLSVYSAGVYADLRRYDAILPEGLRRLAPAMTSGDWLTSYADPDVIPLVLSRMAQRRPRFAPLAAGIGEFDRCRDGLAADFGRFIADARLWARQQEESER